MDELSEQHVKWLIDQQDRSPNTHAARRRVLKSVGNAGTATREDMDAWWVSRNHLAPGTRNVDLSHLRDFYKWCIIYYHRPDDPTIHLRAPKLNNVIYDDKVSNEQIEDLAAVLKPDLARAVMLGAAAGLRVAESAKLNWEEVNTSEDSIKVVESKGGKTRIVFVSPELIAMLGRGQKEKKGNLITAGGKPYTASQLQRKLNRAMLAAGVDFTSHDLRHRFGIVSYRATGDILAVGEQMGHSSVNTTKLYASADSAVKRKIASAVMW